MRINANNQDPININNTVIEDVQNFTYLGSIESRTGGTDEHITARKKKGLLNLKSCLEKHCSKNLHLN